MSLTRQLKDMKRGMLVSPRHEAYLEKGGDVLLTPAVASFVLEQLTTPQRYRGQTFSASARGTCKRQQVFKYAFPHKGKESFTSDTNNYFIHGTWTHLKWQTMGFDAGWLAQAEVVCKIEKYNLSGTIDGILDTGDGWELKSINERGFRMIASDGPLYKHLLQIHAYMMATGIRRWSLIYEDKGTQQWREYVIDYDEGIAAELTEELEEVNHALVAKVLPPPLPKCVLREGQEYKQCPFAKDCLNIKRWPLQRGNADV